MLSGFSYYLNIVALPLKFQIVNIKTASGAGVTLLPLLCACGVGSFAGAAISSRRNFLAQTFWAGSSLILLGSGLMSTLGDSVTVENKCYGFMVILGLGVGLIFSSTSVL